MKNKSVKRYRSSVLGIIWSRNTFAKFSVLIITHLLLLGVAVFLMMNTSLVDSALEIAMLTKVAASGFVQTILSFVKAIFVAVFVIALLNSWEPVPTVYCVGGTRNHYFYY